MSSLRILIADDHNLVRRGGRKKLTPSSLQNQPSQIFMLPTPEPVCVTTHEPRANLAGTPVKAAGV
jgi:hypothetical protein